MLEGYAFYARLGKQYRLLGEQRVGCCQRSATLVEVLHFVGGNCHQVGVAVLQTCVEKLDVAELLRLEGNVFLKAVHIVGKIFLRLAIFLRLEFESGNRFD